jgi:hypothetical protein
MPLRFFRKQWPKRAPVTLVLWTFDGEGAKFAIVAALRFNFRFWSDLEWQERVVRFELQYAAAVNGEIRF